MKSARFSIVETLKFAFWASLEHVFLFFSLFLTWLLSISGILICLAAILLYPVKGMMVTLFSQVDNMNRAELARIILEKFSIKLGLATGILIFSTFVLFHFFQFGFIRIAFDIHDKDSSSISELFSGMPFLVKGLIVSLVYYLMVLGGLMLFVIPGVVAAVTFGFALYVLIDKNCGVQEAFQESARLTKGSRRHIFGLFFIVLVLKQIFMGSFGYIIFWPVGMLATVCLYRKLQTVAQANPPIASA